MKGKLSKIDVIVVCGLVVLAVLVMGARHDFSRTPYEDAAILMRYSENLATGHGIVWNVGEPPIDGATDFLYMVYLAGWRWLGVSLEQATVVSGIGAHLATVILVYLASRLLYRANRWLAGFAAVWLAVGPGFTYTEMFFGTAFFAFFVCLTWVFATWSAQSDRRLAAWAFALSGLVAGLVRPEGCIVAVLALIAVVWYRGWRRSGHVLVAFFSVFLVLGGLYFLWRWQYFGYPFPNPYYRKGGGRIYGEGLKTGIRALVAFGFPFLPAYLLAFWPKETLRRAVFTLIPVVGFTLAWILLSNEMNLVYRFQYPALPMLLIAWPAVMSSLVENLRIPSVCAADGRTRILYVVGTVGLALVLLRGQYNEYSGKAQRADGRADAGRVLAEYRDKGYTIATTEAGLMAYYSGWTTVDTWGLNDYWITHNHGVTAEYLDRYKPQVIAFHAYFSPLVDTPAEVSWFKMDTWDQMVIILRDYAEANGYTLAASFGRSPYNTHYYYVRSDFEDSRAIVEELRGLEYAWPGDGATCMDLAAIGRLEN